MISINKARWIDRKIGRPLCRVVAMLRWLRRKPALPRSPSKILIVKMWGIGTIVLASPVFSNLKRQFPEAGIHFLTLHQNRGIYEGSGVIDRTVYLRFTSIAALAGSFLNLLVYLWREKFDIIFDFEIGSRFTALLTALSFRSLNVGYAPAGSGKNIFDVTIPYSEAVHITQIYLRALDALRFDVKDESLLPLPLSEDDHQEVSRLVRMPDGQRFIALNPNTSELVPERLWPAKHFAELGQKLLREFPGLNVIIIGGGQDVGRAEELRGMIGMDERVISTAGRLSIRGTAALLSRASLLISNDSGPLHLGVAMDIPVIGLFGPETPLHYGPRGAKHRALSAGEICSPCISVYKDKIVDCHKNAICMRHISVERVFHEAVTVLRDSESPIVAREPHRLPSRKVRHET